MPSIASILAAACHVTWALLSVAGHCLFSIYLIACTVASPVTGLGNMIWQPMPLYGSDRGALQVSWLLPTLPLPALPASSTPWSSHDHASKTEVIGNMIEFWCNINAVHGIYSAVSSGWKWYCVLGEWNEHPCCLWSVGRSACHTHAVLVNCSCKSPTHSSVPVYMYTGAQHFLRTAQCNSWDTCNISSLPTRRRMHKHITIVIHCYMIICIFYLFPPWVRSIPVVCFVTIIPQIVRFSEYVHVVMLYHWGWSLPASHFWDMQTCTYASTAWYMYGISDIHVQIPGRLFLFKLLTNIH